MQTAAGYLLRVVIAKGVMDPQGGKWGYFTQTNPLDLDDENQWMWRFQWGFPLDYGARGAVWVSPADLHSAYGIDVDRADPVVVLRLMEATKYRLRPAWRVTCHWEGPAREVAGAGAS